MHIYRRTGSYNATLVKRHGFQEKTGVVRENPGGILTLFNSQTHLKNPGRPSVIFQYFEDVFIIFQLFSLF